MDSNTHSADPTAGLSSGRLAGEVAGRSAGASAGPPGGRRDRLAALTAEVEALADQDLGGLPEVALAEDGVEVGSTAAWLRRRLRLGAGAAASSVRTARALFRGPLVETAAALTAGELSPAHAAAVASGTADLPNHTAAEADPVLVEAAARLDPPGLRRVLGHLRLVADPDGADHTTERRHDRRGVWLAPTWEGMVAIDGLLEAEAGQTLLAALEPWPVRPTPAMAAAAANGTPMPSPSWPAGPWRAAGCQRPAESGPS